MAYNPNTDAMNEIYLSRAYKYAASKSYDPSTQNAAILWHPIVGIVVQAANGIPEKLTTSEDIWQSEDKYLYVEHAERNVIYKAANRGIVTEGLTMYCPWICCADCARAIIQAGIIRVIGHKNIIDMTPDRWKKSCDVGIQMLKDAGIQCGFWEGKACKDATQIRFNGELISP